MKPVVYHVVIKSTDKRTTIGRPNPVETSPTRAGKLMVKRGSFMIDYSFSLSCYFLCLDEAQPLNVANEKGNGFLKTDLKRQRNK